MKDLHITHPNEQQTEEMLGIKGYKFLGWENGWKEQPLKVEFCRANKHPVKEKQHNQRGSNNTVWCENCEIYWKYDSSD